jgi:dodecin
VIIVLKDFQERGLTRRLYWAGANTCTEKGGDTMTNRIARVTEIISASPKSFDDALQTGFKRATKTLRGVTGIRILEQRVAVENNKLVEYRIRMEVIFVLES